MNSMRVLHDLFPATIVLSPPGVFSVDSYIAATTSGPISSPSKFLDRVRLVVAQDDKSQLVMVAADHHSGPRLIFSERLTDFTWSGAKTADSQLITESGKVIAFKYVKGCNCGSRLRSWSPYVIMNSIKDPT